MILILKFFLANIFLPCLLYPILQFFFFLRDKYQCQLEFPKLYLILIPLLAFYANHKAKQNAFYIIIIIIIFS